MAGVSLSIFLASKRNQGRTLGAEVRWLSEWTASSLLLLGSSASLGRTQSFSSAAWLGTAVKHRQASLEGVPLLCFPKSSWWLSPVIWPDSACPASGEKRIGVPAAGIRPRPAHCTSNVSVPAAPGSDVQTHPREGHRSHSLGTSSAFWPSPPLPGEGAAAWPAAAGAERPKQVCVSSSLLRGAPWAAAAAVAGAVAGAGAAAAGAVPPGPCGSPPRSWPWWCLGWRRAPGPGGSGSASDPFCWEGRCIFPAPAFGLWSPHRTGWAAFGVALSASWRSCCLSLIVSAASWPSGSCSRGPGSSWWTESWCNCTSCAPRTGWLRSPAA